MTHLLTHWRHSIEHKLLFVITCSFVLVMVLVSCSSIYFMNRDQETWEKHEINKLVQISRNLMNSRFQQLNDLTMRYAENNETYRYIDDANLDFVYSHLLKETLELSRLVGILIQDREGHFVIGQTTLNQRFANLMFDQLLKNKTLSARHGVITFDKKLYMFTSAPVSDTTGTAPTNGIVTLIREVDGGVIVDVAKELGSHFTISVAKPSLYVKAHLMSGYTPVTLRTIEYKDTQVIGSFDVVMDHGSDPVLKGTIGLNKRELGLANIGWRLFFVCLTLVAVVLLMHWWLRRMVTLPIVKLVSHLTSQSGDLKCYKPIAVTKTDEFGELSKRINGTFLQLYRQHAFNRMLFDAIGEALITLDHHGHVTFANPAAALLFDMPAEQLTGLRLDFLLTNLSDDQQSILSLIKDVVEYGRELDLDCQVRLMSQEQSTAVQILGHPMRLEEERSTGAVFIIRTIKQAIGEDRETWCSNHPSGGQGLAYRVAQ